MNVTYHPNAVEQDSLEPFIKGRRRETSYKPVIENILGIYCSIIQAILAQVSFFDFWLRLLSDFNHALHISDLNAPSAGRFPDTPK